ncbi:flagellum-specific ATP synthase FliI [Chromatiales bacterium (ex Bugula neritina AB1)]|nr:flagellum-specific ATP synthase FliI [Chromatiales bacterium (ex Bugula neritina AB1)]
MLANYGFHEKLREYRVQLQPPQLPVTGELTRVTGQLLEATGCVARCGEICRIETTDGSIFDAEVVGFDDNKTCLMPYDDIELVPGSKVTPLGIKHRAPIGVGLLGRVIDSRGEPIDGHGPLENVEFRSLETTELNPLTRAPINTPLDVGIRSINGLLTLGQGQRVGLFAASGLGKSVLLGMMTRRTTADITVICLLGERGREVREYVQDILGPEELSRAIVVAVPADHTPLRRVTAISYATAIAEYFRDCGQNALLLVDSLTRYAQAAREIGLAAGELPVTRGYPASVFSKLPQLLERGGCTSSGSITAIYTVLKETDDDDDPVAESVKSILDGHIVLSRKLAESGHFPAIDILASTSRLKDAVTSPAQQQAAQRFLQLYSHYQQNQDLLSVGMYQAGSDPELDKAIELLPSLNSYLRQSIQQEMPFESCVTKLQSIVESS